MDPSNIHESMRNFFEGWITKLEDYYAQLLSLTISSDSNNDQQCNELIIEVLGHFSEYYREKSKVAREDVFFVMHAPWLTTYEQTSNWLSGFQPAMVFSLIKNSIRTELSPKQVGRLERLESEIARYETEIEAALAQVQRYLELQKMLNFIITHGRLKNHGGGGTHDIMDELKVALMVTIDNVARLTGLTVRKIMEILNPHQAIKFLAETAKYVIIKRALGIVGEAETA